jgi:hypothetical protein
MDEAEVSVTAPNTCKTHTDPHDENMLVTHGDKRIPDIYFGEFLRLQTHYAFREAVKSSMERKKAGKPEDWKPQFRCTIGVYYSTTASRAAGQGAKRGTKIT